jgi:hypothetical protein
MKIIGVGPNEEEWHQEVKCGQVLGGGCGALLELEAADLYVINSRSLSFPEIFICFVCPVCGTRGSVTGPVAFFQKLPTEDAWKQAQPLKVLPT